MATNPLGDGVSPFPSGEPARERVTTRRFKNSATFIATFDEADVWMQAPGGGGAGTNATDRGSAGGSSGQTLIGRVKFQRGKRYTYTQGAVGLGAAATSSTSTSGAHAGDSSLVGPGVNLRLKGGWGGLGGALNGGGTTAGLYLGVSGASPLGHTIYALATGGGAVIGGTGLPGTDSLAPVMPGGRPGASSPSGGGGGSTAFGRGGQGGSAGQVGGAADADSGAGGGGSGASSDGTANPGGGNGANGFLQITAEQ